MLKQTSFCRLLIAIITLVVVLLSWRALSPTNEFITKALDEYDYIIVGGGTAGSVLASRLSEDARYTVLLVEAGDNFNFVASIPLLATTLQGTKYDWSFRTLPQKTSSFGLNNHTQFLPRGKGLGGSGQINYMIHGNPVPQDFNLWQNDGLLGWNYETIRAHLIHSTQDISFPEKDECPLGDDERVPINNGYCSVHKVGPRLYLKKQHSKLSNTFHRSTKELDFLKYYELKSTIHMGKRWTSYHAYLKPILGRQNLHILLNTLVIKVIFNGKSATGIEVLSEDGTKQTIFCKRDVILSAGTFNTPQILLLSGVGNSEQLQKLNVPVVLDLPGVGQNLHDHLNMPLYVSIEQALSFTVNKALKLSEVFRYLAYSSGYFAETPMAGVTKGPRNTAVLLFGMGSTDEKILKDVSNFKTETFRSLFPLHQNSSQEGFVFLATCLQPTSRGVVYVNSTEPDTQPIIDPQYLSTAHDADCMVRAMKLVKQIASTPAFKEIGAKVHWPKLQNCMHVQVDPDNDEYLECILRASALTGHHPAGTCAMGLYDDQYSVVDAALRVKGALGLRVMDASVLPKPLSTFPNSALIAMSEHAANLIIQERSDC